MNEQVRRVISRRFGLEDGHPRRLDEVAQEFKITVDDCRRMEASVLETIRADPSDGPKMSELLQAWRDKQEGSDPMPMAAERFIELQELIRRHLPSNS